MKLNKAFFRLAIGGVTGLFLVTILFSFTNMSGMSFISIITQTAYSLLFAAVGVLFFILDPFTISQEKQEKLFSDITRFKNYCSNSFFTNALVLKYAAVIFLAILVTRSINIYSALYELGPLVIFYFPFSVISPISTFVIFFSAGILLQQRKIEILNIGFIIYILGNIFDIIDYGILNSYRSAPNSPFIYAIFYLIVLGYINMYVANSKV